jgi:hypothetical protein
MSILRCTKKAARKTKPFDSHAPFISIDLSVIKLANSVINALHSTSSLTFSGRPQANQLQMDRQPV